ncbi:MAG: GvpL/GvpF family gas vesicle protein [Desulfotomaculaceae bacterium]
MQHLPGLQKELLKNKHHSRLSLLAAEINDYAWEEAVKRCRLVLTDLYTELLLEKLQEEIKTCAPDTGRCSGSPASIGNTGPRAEQLVEQEQKCGNQREDGVIEYTYTYCLAPARAVELFAGEELRGLPDGGPVRAIKCGRLIAVVSSVPAEIYGEEALQDVVQDPAWLESRVTGHEQLIQQVMHHHPVIPMKFCTIFDGDERANQIISEREEEFHMMLADVAGKEEWGLKIYCQPGVLRERVEKTSTRVIEAREKSEASASGAAYFMLKKLDGIINEEMDVWAAKLAREVNIELDAWADRTKMNKLLGSDVTGRLEKMILNAVYLVDKAKVKDFIKAVSELGEKHRENGIEFALTGPWPPYNFTSINRLGGAGANGEPD